MNKNNEKIITMGEIMLRLTPPDYNKIEQAGNFLANYGGGEANVAVSLSHFGHNCYFISKLPPNELGDGAIKHLMSHGVNTNYVVRGSSTMGIYFLESGFGGRPGKVIYNRKHSAATHMEICDFDFNEIFKDATWFHLSGITLALGSRTREVALYALKKAHENNVKVSFDFNYRSTLWSIEDAKKIYPLVMPYVNTLFASPFDLTEILNMPNNLEEGELFKEAIKKFNLDYIFGKTRKIFSSTDQAMKAYVYTSSGKDETNEIEFQIYDRIGAGDAFASGVIHALLKDYNNSLYAAKFGIVNSILKQTIYGDVSIFTEKDIVEYMNNLGKSEVKR